MAPESICSSPPAGQNEEPSSVTSETQPSSSNKSKTIISPLQSSESYTYHFDAPDVHAPGTLTIYKNLIVFSFPKYSLQTGDSKEYINANQKNVQLIINNRLCFNSQWTPVYTQQDWYRMNDMFQQGYQEVLNQSFSWYTTVQHDFKHRFHHEKKSYLYNNNVSVQSSENLFNTVINLNINCIEQSESNLESGLPVHIQIYLGDELFVCTKSILSNFDFNTVNNVVLFILSKLIKW